MIMYSTKLNLRSIALLQGCLPMKTDHQPWVDWCSTGGTRLSSGLHMLYHHSVAHFHGSVENVAMQLLFSISVSMQGVCLESDN